MCYWFRPTLSKHAWWFQSLFSPNYVAKVEEQNFSNARCEGPMGIGWTDKSFALSKRQRTIPENILVIFSSFRSSVCKLFSVLWHSDRLTLLRDLPGNQQLQCPKFVLHSKSWVSFNLWKDVFINGIYFWEKMTMNHESKFDEFTLTTPGGTGEGRTQ